MKSVKTIIPALILLITFTGSITGAEQTKSDKSFKVKKGGTLTMDLNPGEIRVMSWEREEVLISVPMIDQEELERIKYSVNGGNVKVEYSSYWGGDDDIIFSVTVPKEFNLDLVTKVGEVYLKGNIEGSVNVKSNAGDISIMDVKGDVTLATSGGEIKTGDVTGELNINTLGGDLQIGHLYGQNAKITTMGGDISIKNSTAVIKAKTMGGDITAGETGSGTELITFGGSVNAGKAKGNIKLETYGGDLILLGATGNVNARTMGGDITLNNVKGSIYAKTQAGNIIAELSPSKNSSSEITSSSGGVKLYLPASADVTVYAKAKTYGGYEGDFKPVYSEFKETYYNSKSRYTEASYKINEGTANINVTSTDDRIQILKQK